MEKCKEELGFELFDATSEIVGGDNSTFGRQTTDEVILSKNLRSALLKLNLDLPQEALDNALDEALAGFSKKVYCIITDDYIQVMDEGRGIPVGIHPKYEKEKKSTLEVIMTQLHAGGKIKEGAYATGSSGVHGVGISCTNALSDYLQVWTYRDKNWWSQTYKRGEPVSPVHKEKPDFSWKCGTIVRFKPDETILPVSSHPAASGNP